MLTLLFYLLRFVREVVRLRFSVLSSSSSLLELELERVEVRLVVVGRVRELDDDVRLTVCDWVRVGVDLDVVTDELRCFVRSLLLLLKRELDEVLVRLEEDTDLR